MLIANTNATPSRKFSPKLPPAYRFSSLSADSGSMGGSILLVPHVSPAGAYLTTGEYHPMRPGAAGERPVRRVGGSIERPRDLESKIQNRACCFFSLKRMILLANSPGGGAGAAGPRDVSVLHLVRAALPPEPGAKPNASWRAKPSKPPI